MYNRGFTRKGVTPDMLPDEWSDAKKEQFIEDGKARIKKSRWMLYIIVPLCFVFIVEIFLAFVWPSIYSAIQSAIN
jgi:phosphotransferase system  glucose/maltose/N-acetylglucosamine-specific IIC component